MFITHGHAIDCRTSQAPQELGEIRLDHGKRVPQLSHLLVDNLLCGMASFQKIANVIFVAGVFLPLPFCPDKGPHHPCKTQCLGVPAAHWQFRQAHIAKQSTLKFTISLR